MPSTSQCQFCKVIFSPLTFPQKVSNLNGFLSVLLLAISKGWYHPLNLFSGAQMVEVIVLKTISCMATPPKPPEAKSILHFCVDTLRKKSTELQGFMKLPACFSMVESSHLKYYLKHFSLSSHDWAEKLEQWPGHWTKQTVSLNYSNFVIPSTKTNAFLWYSEWKPTMLAEELVTANMSKIHI